MENKYINRFFSVSWSRICTLFHFKRESLGQKTRKINLDIKGYDEKFDFINILWFEDIKYINRLISMSWLRICILFYFSYETLTQKKTIKIIRKNRLFYFKNLQHQTLNSSKNGVRVGFWYIHVQIFQGLWAILSAIFDIFIKHLCIVKKP